ncbi:MAG TPA: aminotransferase class I/II-fold pyridoxal phosphate-dependent enzyme [Vicinamibacterales bacterium]
MALAAVVTLPAAGQPRARSLESNTFFQMESVSNPQISPDGGQVVFSRGFVDIMKDQSSSNLWVIDVKGERLRQLTEGTWRDSSPAWSPDGKRIAFLSDRSGSTQIHVMWADRRETLQLTRVERAPGGLEWSPDGKALLFTTSIPDETPVLPVKLPPMPRGAQLAKGAVLVDRRVLKSSPTTCILVDEAYHEYVEDPAYRTALPLALENPQVVVARTFSKVYGLAGLRVGYAVGHADTLKAMGRFRIANNINVLAAAAAIAGLPQDAHVARQVALNRAAREFWGRACDDDRLSDDVRSFCAAHAATLAD